MHTTIEKYTELTERLPTIEDVRRGLREKRLSCIDLARAKLLHAIPIDEGWAIVVGDRDNGAYEWVRVECSGKSYIDGRGYQPRLESDEKWTCSDDGWGGAASALFDLLRRVEGPSCDQCGCCVGPEEIRIACRHCTEASSVTKRKRDAWPG